MSSLAAKGLTDLQENILILAYERLLEEEDLSFGEIFITVFGCKPERIGSKKVQKLSLGKVLVACRLEPPEIFHFSDKEEEEKYHLAQASVSEAVAELVKKGFLVTTKAEKLRWAKDEPRVERIEYYEMVRLTEEGVKVITDKRRHHRHSLILPVECYWAESKTGHPAFTLNISEEGLSIDLLKKLEVGETLILRFFTHGSIEILAKIVWINRPTRKGEMYRSGMRIVKLSPENQNRLRNLLANV